jgi:hypothetical protein
MWASRSHGSCYRHWGNKPSSSGSPGACLLAQTTRNHSSSCRHGGYKPVGRGSSGACLPCASFQEPQEPLQSWENKAALRPAYKCGLPGAISAAAGMGYPSLWAMAVLGPACQVPVSRSHRSCCSHRTTKPVGAGALGPGRLLGVWYSTCCQHGEPSFLTCSFCYQWCRRSPGSCIYRGAGFPNVSG